MNAALPHPVDPALFWSVDPLQLRAGRCRKNGRLVFPAPADEGRFEPVALPSEGHIWSWTIQRFPPKALAGAGGEPFQPFALGYVDLGPIIVETRFCGFAFEALRVGLGCRLVPEDWNGRLGYAFAPLEDGR